VGITVDASLCRGDIRTGCLGLAWDESGGNPFTGQVVSGVEVT